MSSLSALVVLSSLLGASAQAPAPKPPSGTPPAQPSKVRAQEIAVDLRGCIRGTRLQLTPGAVNDAQLELLRATDFILEGPRDLLQQLAHDHQDHEEAIRGIAIIPPQPANATIDIKTVKRGGTTVTGGVRESGGSIDRSPALTGGDSRTPVRLRVQSITHIAEKCTPKT